MPRQVKKKRKDGLYTVNVYIGRVDGKSKYKSVYGKSQKEVNKKAEEIRAQLGRGINVNAANDTFEKWSELWLDNKSVTVSQSRLNTCKTHLAKLSPLYQYEIAKIKTSDIQKIINDLCRKNPTTGKPASKDLLRCVKNTASQIFATAINNRVLDYNPADAVTIPTRAEETTRTALTDEQISWIVNTPHRAQLPAMIMLYAGLRRGEVLALTWSDVHLKTKTISVNKSVEMISGKPQIKKGGKTDAATRTVKIPDILVLYLDDAYNHFKDSVGKNIGSVLVCPNTQGQVMSSSSWESLWLSYMRDLNLKYGDFSEAIAPRTIKKYVPEKIPMVIDTFTAHQLRHTFATILYKSGIDILTAKDQLGHSDIKTTLEIYTHLDKEFKSQSMDQLNDFLNKKGNFKMIDSKC